LVIIKQLIYLNTKKNEIIILYINNYNIWYISYYPQLMLSCICSDPFPFKLNKVDENGSTMLINACKSNDTFLACKILQYPNMIDIGHIDNLGHTAIFWACYNGMYDVIPDLLSWITRCNIQQPGIYGLTPLMCACLKQLDDVVLEMLKYPELCNLSHKDENGNTVLMHAVNTNRLNIVKKIITFHGLCGIDSINKENNTALILATKKMYYPIAHILLKHIHKNHVNKDCGQRYAFNILIENIQKNNLITEPQKKLIWKIVKYPRFCDFRKTFKHNKNISMILLELEQLDMVFEILGLDEYLNIYAVDDNKCTLLITAMKVLIKINKQTTPIEYETKYYIDCIIKKLIKYSDIVKYYDNNNDTALIYTCKNNLTTVAKYILQNKDKCDINHFNNEGNNAFIIACWNNNADLANIMLPYCDITHKNKLGYTALNYAMGNDMTDIIKIIMQNLIHNDNITLNDLIKTTMADKVFHEIKHIIPYKYKYIFYSHYNKLDELIGLQQNQTDTNETDTTDKTDKKNKECLICFNDNNSYTFLVNCKHTLNMCDICKINITNKKITNCPICREIITETFKTYVVE
jgi:ankyrin repeat protein